MRPQLTVETVLEEHIEITPTAPVWSPVGTIWAEIKQANAYTFTVRAPNRPTLRYPTQGARFRVGRDIYMIERVEGELGNHYLTCTCRKVEPGEARPRQAGEDDGGRT